MQDSMIQLPLLAEIKIFGNIQMVCWQKNEETGIPVYIDRSVNLYVLNEK